MSADGELRDPRAIAADWHDGQMSAMYAYASSGTIIDGLDIEVERCIRSAERDLRGLYSDDDRAALRSLADHLSEEGCEIDA